MDLRFEFDTDLKAFDLGIELNEFSFDDGLETAVLISLFSDARVDLEELPEGESSRRGFWGDAVVNPDAVATGSKLWLLDRAKATDETLELAREYALEALQWLVDDQVAESVEVTTEYISMGVMKIGVEITRPGDTRENYRYDFVWEVRASGFLKTVA